MAAGIGAKDLQEYLVSLGVKLDEKGMTKLETFLKGSKAGFLALAGALVAGTTILYKFVQQTSEAALALEKQARAEHKNIEAVRASENALKAMGKTKKEVAKDASLKKFHDDLVLMNKAMALPDGSRGFSIIRDIGTEFTKVKSTVQYAIQWIHYHILTKLEGPLTRLRDGIKVFRENMQIEMPLWTAKIADGIGIFVRLLETAVRAGKGIIQFIKNLPDEVKTTGIAIGALWGILKANPLTLILGGLTALLLLLDDFYAYQQGRPSALSELWKSFEDGSWSDKIGEWVQEGLDKASEKLGEFVSGLSDFIENHRKDIDDAGKLLGRILGAATGLAVQLLVGAIQIGAALVKNIVDYVMSDEGYSEIVKAGTIIGTALADGIKQILNELLGPLLGGDLFPDQKQTEAIAEIIQNSTNETAIDKSSQGAPKEWGEMVRELIEKTGVKFANTSEGYEPVNPSFDVFEAVGGLLGLKSDRQQIYDAAIEKWRVANESKDQNSFVKSTYILSALQKGVDMGLGGEALQEKVKVAYDEAQAYLDEHSLSVDVKMNVVTGSASDEEVSIKSIPWYSKGNSQGGRYDKPIATPVAEDYDTEYIIPIKKPSRAIPLIRQMLFEMGSAASKALEGFGITPDTDIDALVASKGLGFPGKPGNVLNIVNNYNNTVTATTNITVQGAGQDAQAVGQATYNAHERSMVRYLKGVISQ